MTIAEKLANELGEKIKATGEPFIKTLKKLGIDSSTYYNIRNGDGYKIRKKTLNILKRAIKKVDKMNIVVRSTPEVESKPKKTSRRKPKSALGDIDHVIRNLIWSVNLLNYARENLVGDETQKNKKK